MLPKITSQPQYSPLGAVALHESETHDCNDSPTDRRKASTSLLPVHLILPWIVSATLLLLLLIQLARSKAESCDHEAGWKPYEIKAAMREIPLVRKTVKFSGTLKIVDGLGLVREIGPTMPDFVGKPSPELDAAWDDIIHPLNIFVTEDELEGDKEGTSPDPETGLYVIMPQGFHDLHCLNMIRKRLHLTHYAEYAAMNQSVLDVHIEHCIDALRQSLMCTGDMTMIKTFWIPSRHRVMADFDNTHSCRDFDVLKSWARARDAEDGSNWRQSADRLLNSKIPAS